MATGQHLNLPESTNHLAYVFYATTHAYAVAVMVFVRMLQRLGMRSDVDLLVLHLPVSGRVLSQMRAMGLTTIEVAPLPHINHAYFKDCLVKLRIFQLTRYERVLFIDADSIPLKNLDYLLRFPFDGPVAAPKAYWLPQPFWTTALLLIRPSDESWNRLSRRIATAAYTNSYDMEIANAEFGSEITTLPLNVFSLNSEWEDRRRPGFFGDFEDSYSKISVVHFTALGKPWFYSPEDVRRLRPDAHPVFYRLWESWRTTREELSA